MVAEQPHDLAGMAQINGVGEQKLDRFGAAFLSVIATHRADLEQQSLISS